MLRFIVRRLLQMVGVVVVLSLLLFLWLRMLPGGTVSAMLGERATPEKRAALTKALGLDQPLYVQYWTYMKRAAHGSFGASTGVLPGRDAFDIFLARFPATIELSTFSIVIAVSIGIPLGYLSARRRGTLFDNASVMGSLVGVAIPVFFLAYLLKYVFAVKLGWLPVSGRQSGGLPGRIASPVFFLAFALKYVFAIQLGVLPPSGRQSVGINATHITGLFVLDGLLTREWDAPGTPSST